MEQNRDSQNKLTHSQSDGFPQRGKEHKNKERIISSISVFGKTQYLHAKE
jgi:hypothetical protein